MSDGKKYYYLKLKENFFDSDAMIVLESMQDGYLYSNILLKLYLRSLKNDGRLIFNNTIPYNPSILAKVTRHSVGVVEKALEIFKKIGLIEILDNGEIYILEIQNFIGESSTEADRIRNYRKKITDKKQILIHGCTNGVQMYDKRTPEIEIEIDTEKEIKKDICASRNILFDQFWFAYPLKKSKERSRKNFEKLKVDEKLLQTILDAIELQKQEKEVKRQNGNFVPEWKHPTTWLNGKCWEDEVDLTLKTGVNNERFNKKQSIATRIFDDFERDYSEAKKRGII